MDEAELAGVLAALKTGESASFAVGPFVLAARRLDEGSFEVRLLDATASGNGSGPAPLDPHRHELLARRRWLKYFARREVGHARVNGAQVQEIHRGLRESLAAT